MKSAFNRWINENIHQLKNDIAYAESDDSTMKTPEDIVYDYIDNSGGNVIIYLMNTIGLENLIESILEKIELNGKS